jgi:hypothetical protein
LPVLSCCHTPSLSPVPAAQFQLNTQGPGKRNQARAATRLFAATRLHDNNGLTLHICTGEGSLSMARVTG